MAETAAKAIKATTLGKQAKTDLPISIFGEDFHESLVHEAARADLAARRRGAASTLGRGEVSMSTAKAWKQKGTGRARAGALSVPHRRGGGVAFGPKPRNHSFKVNRKARRRALRSALSVHASRDSIAVIDVAGYDTPSTKNAAKALSKWGPKGPTLIVLGAEEATTLKSFRNLPRVSVMPAAAIGVADVLGHASMIVSPAALEVLEAKLGEVKRKASRATNSDTPGSEAEDVAGSGSEDVAGSGSEDVAGSGSEDVAGSDSDSGGE